MPRVFIIEGVPGSGKSSLAKFVSNFLTEQRLASEWFREEANDHPVIGKQIRRTASESNFARNCLDGWRSFVRTRVEPNSDMAHVLEGCFFQSTVRFLLEYEHSDRDVADYIAGVESELATVDVSLIYLCQSKSGMPLVEDMIRRKGWAVVKRIAKYTEQTPYAHSRGLRGTDAVASLYTDYKRVCDSLVDSSNFPKLHIDAYSNSAIEVQDCAASWIGERTEST